MTRTDLRWPFTIDAANVRNRIAKPTRVYPLDVRTGMMGKSIQIPVLVLWVMALMALTQWISGILKEEFTYGDIAAITSPILVAVTWAIVAWCLRTWNRNHSFRLRFADQPYDLSPGQARIDRTYSRKKILPCGRSKLTVAVWTRTEAKMGEFNIRLINHTFIRRLLFLRSINADCNKVYIDQVSVPEWSSAVTVPATNKEEGFYISSQMSKSWVIGEILWIKLIIIAHEGWSGFLSFEGKTDRRVCAPGRLIINPYWR